jgi:hypothetical protein
MLILLVGGSKYGRKPVKRSGGSKLFGSPYRKTVCAECHINTHTVFEVCGHISVLGLSNDCSSLTIMSEMPHVD